MALSMHKNFSNLMQEQHFFLNRTLSLSP